MVAGSGMRLVEDGELRALEFGLVAFGFQLPASGRFLFGLPSGAAKSFTLDTIVEVLGRFCGTPNLLFSHLSGLVLHPTPSIPKTLHNGRGTP